jgi:cytochrome c-type protein NapC
MRNDPFLLAALATTVIAAVLLGWFLFKRPALNRATKIVLLFGIGILPLITATSGNVAGYHAMKTRTFCGSCHVMTPYADDAADPTSLTLAARHGRNKAFGAENCYTCHADYGMFGTITTKLGGLRHVYEYTLNFHQLTLEEALPRIRIRKPFPNSTCIRCHSTENPLWQQVGDHASTLTEVRADKLSCASAGCHGPPHPFGKLPEERARAGTLLDRGAP